MSAEIIALHERRSPLDRQAVLSRIAGRLKDKLFATFTPEQQAECMRRAAKRRAERAAEAGYGGGNDAA